MHQLLNLNTKQTPTITVRNTSLDRNEGVSWEISPDLTRNDDSKQGKGGGPLTNEAVGAENYGT